MAQTDPQQRGRLVLSAGLSVIIVVLVVAGIVFNRQSNANVQLANTAQAASTFAIAQQATTQANAEEAQQNAKNALAQQLAAQAQLIASQDSGNVVSVLLATQSMQIVPNGNAALVLKNSPLPILVARLTDEAAVYSVAFSSDGKYVVSGGLIFRMAFLVNAQKVLPACGNGVRKI